MLSQIFKFYVLALIRRDIQLQRIRKYTMKRIKQSINICETDIVAVRNHRFSNLFLKQFPSMSKLKDKVANTLIHLPIDSAVNPFFGTFLGLFGALQLTAVVTNGNATLHKITAWADPNNSISPQFSVIAGTTVTVLYTLALLIRFCLTDDGQKLVHPTKFLKVLGVILAYLRTIWECVLLGPLLIGCLKIWTGTNDNQLVFALSIIGAILFFLVAYPVSLYCYIDTTVFTENGDRKFTVLNPELFFHVYKLSFIIFTVISQRAMDPINAFFLIIYTVLIIKRPYFTYARQQFKRYVLSALALVCATRPLNALLSRYQGSLFVELAAIGCYVGLVELISQYRLKKVLEAENFTVYKAKLLIFMAGDLPNYLEFLQKFIFEHHQLCANPICKCEKVIEHLGSPNSNLYEERIWYQFIVSYVEGQFDLRQIDNLLKTDQKILITKYKELVFDIAQIYLFKLNQKNSSFLVTSVYKSYLKAQGFFDEFWDSRRYRTFFYYFEKEIQGRGQVQQSINATPEKYVGFQMEYKNYLKSMFQISKKVSIFWKQMLKREPQQQKILQTLQQIEHQNSQVKKNYVKIMKIYNQSNEMINMMTKDYHEFVYNISENDTGYFIKDLKPEQFAQKKIKDKGIDTARLYSYESQTPTCLVSVDPITFGKIQFTNSFFDDIMELECGKITNIEELILPEIKNWHRQKIQQIVRQDKLNYFHSASFILNAKRKLVYAEMMVQIVPSVSEGLRYAVFLNEFLPEKSMFLTYNDQFEILYDSQSFERLTDSKLGYQSLKDAFSTQKLAQLSEKKVLDLELGSDMYRANLLTQIKADKTVLLLEFKLIDLNSSKINVQVEENKDITPVTKKSRFRVDSPKLLINTNTITTKNKTIIAKELTLKQKVQNKKIGKIFQYFDDRDVKFIGYIKFAQIWVAILMIGLLIAAVLTKVKNKHSYLNAWDNNQKYLQACSKIQQTALNLQLTNLYHGLPMSQNAYNDFVASPDINTYVLDFTNYYDQEDITEQWLTLNFFYNKTITPGTQNNLVLIDNYLQRPLSNLSRYAYVDYSFQIDYASLPSPLTPIQQQFYTIVINSLYSVLPNLSTIKKKLSQRVYRYLVNQSNLSRSLTTITFVILSFGYFFVYIYTIRMNRLRNAIYDMLESVPIEVIEEKIGNCELFNRKYNDETIEEDRANKLPMIDTRSLVSSRNASRTEARDNNFNFRTSKIQEGGTQVEMVRGFGSFYGRRQHERADTTAQMRRAAKKYPKEQIFERSYWIPIFFKIGLPILFLILGCAALPFSQKYQILSIKKFIDRQDDMNYLSQQISQLRLYLTHFGVYNPQLQQYKSITGTIGSKIGQLTFLSKFVPTLQKSDNQFFLVDNICDLERSGFYANINLPFRNRGNYTHCINVAGGALTQGYSAAMNTYLQQAGVLFGTNTQIATYNQTQKQAYLNNSFFTSTAQMIDYLVLHVHWIKDELQKPIRAIIYVFIAIWNTIWLLMIITVVLNIWINGKFCFRCLRRDVKFVRSSYSLVSYKNIIAEPKLKQQFLYNSDELQLLK